ncbi:MAG: zinc-ribbon domain-containing protein [Cyclobacteriaceae bacterium]
MIIYGSNERDILSKELPHQSCQNCQTKGSIVAQVNQRYAHVFWIPIFPVGKPVYSICSNCKQVLKKKEMDESLKREVMDAKSESRTPLYSFAGLGILVLLVAFFTYQSAQTDNKESGYLSEPKVEDVYVIETREEGKKAYYFGKVAALAGDTVYLNYSNYVVYRRPTNSNYKKNLQEKSDFYNPVEYYLLANELASLHQSDSLVSVFRED